MTSSYTCDAARVVQGQAATIPGTLSVDEVQIGWAPLDASQCQSFKVALQAITGTLQKAKSKPQLRIPTISGPLMLEFASMEARDAAITQITPQLARKSAQPASVVEPTGPLAAVKKELLQEDKDLRSLYAELVKEGVITDAEFWKGRQDVVLRKAGGGAGGRQQVVGLSSALLAQLQPSADGRGKQMTMTITAQFIQQVFAEKPHVHRAFVENVPQKMDEKEFWTRFAKHEIQIQEKRKAASKRTHEPPDPLFSRLTPAAAQKVDTSGIDPTVNLAVDNYDNPRGSADDAYPQGEGRSIARDMNLHSAVVLQGPIALSKQQAPPSEAGPSSSGDREAMAAAQPSEAWRSRGSSGLEDLRSSRQDEADELHIRNPRRYFERAGQSETLSASADPLSKEAIAASLRDPRLRLAMDPSAAEQVLQDLQRECTSALPDTWVSGTHSGALVPQMQTMLRQTALVCNELLRQFWRCLPLQASVARERRATRLKEVMDKKYTQLEHMQGAAQAEDRQVVAQLLRPIRQALDAGLEAYQSEMRGVRA